MEVVGTPVSTMACGIVDLQTVATIRFNSAFRAMSNSSNCERITRTMPTRDDNDCCNTTEYVGSWQTYDDINSAISVAESAGLGSGTIADPWRIGA